jgi:hypothetical protein
MRPPGVKTTNRSVSSLEEFYYNLFEKVQGTSTEKVAHFIPKKCLAPGLAGVKKICYTQIGFNDLEDKDGDKD